MKDNRLGRFFAAALWLFGTYEVVTAIVRLFLGTAKQTPLLGEFLQPGSGLEWYVALALLSTFAFLLFEIARLGSRLIRESTAASVFDSGDGANRAAIPERSMARNRADLIELSMGPSSDKLGQVLSAASAMDGASLETMFSLSRALTWALPSLGFIGAALGLSKSIGGFSTALSDPDKNKLIASLAQQVIPGIAGSFYVTIAALAAATVGHLCVTSLLAWGHVIIHRLDTSNLKAVARLTGPSQATFDLRVVESRLGTLVAEVQKLGSELNVKETELAVVAATKKLENAAGELRNATDLFIDSIERPYVVRIEREKIPTPNGIRR